MTLDRIEYYKKAAVALVIAAIALLAFFVQFDPGFQAAAVAVVVAVFNVAAVAMAQNHTLDDVQKAVQALTASAIALAMFFTTVDANTAENITAAVVAFVNVYGVWRATNGPRPD